MSDASAARPKRRTAADYKAELDEIYAEMDRRFAAMAKEREEIERLKIERREIRRQTREILASLGAVL